MLNLLRIGTGLAFVLAIACGILWRELRDERELTAQLRLQVTAPAMGDRGEPQPSPGANERPGSAAPASVKPGDPTVPVVVNAAQVNTAPSALPDRVLFSAGIEGDLMKDPEYRKARLAQAKMNLRRNYTDVSEEVGLSARETEQLFDILAEMETGSSLSMVLGSDGQPDRQAMEEMQRNRQELRRKQQESVQALIGPGRQAQWQDYQLSLSARSRATSMTSMLAASGQPLTDAQLRPLTKALIAEEKQVRLEQQSAPRETGPMNAQSAARMQEQSIKHQEESNRRYLETAAAYMSPQQVALVRDVLAQQIAVSRASLRVQLGRAQQE